MLASLDAKERFDYIYTCAKLFFLARPAKKKKSQISFLTRAKSCTIKPLFCLLADVINSLTKHDPVAVVFFIKQILRLQRKEKFIFLLREEGEKGEKV
jgi:hypothetical protein